ncbi:MAG: hypothetical protein CO126_06000 [Hydrogenophilales bacterium CG_4_9_14_3_um_filter_63_34]|nr:MAG: hypothetical protein COZ24_05005 [Hydrogenophilales bacterium CG_4_10_14_3_um_filter_63_21]PJB03906.1 MAG: hypothetical protein CO126_06000 [Hydrogenophilales bacterium CG_4_9_14_3_um_filter_63_34]
MEQVGAFPVDAGIQARAAEEAIPYQTLIASVLHKFVTGRLVEPSPTPMNKVNVKEPTPRARRYLA